MKSRHTAYEGSFPTIYSNERSNGAYIAYHKLSEEVVGVIVA